jgi:hypothetical protein
MAACGGADQCWTLARMADLVWRRLGAEHTLTRTGLLRHRIGCSVQIPARRVAERHLPGLIDGFLASTRLRLTPFSNPRIEDLLAEVPVLKLVAGIAELENDRLGVAVSVTPMVSPLVSASAASTPASLLTRFISWPFCAFLVAVLARPRGTLGRRTEMALKRS